MAATRFRTDDLPRQERFASWAEILAHVPVPCRVRSTHEHDFQAQAMMMDLGVVQVYAARFSPIETCRTPRLIRQSDPEVYELQVVLSSGPRMVSQAGREATVGERRFLLSSSSLPYQDRVTIETGLTTLAGVVIPQRSLHMPVQGIDQLIARPFSARTGLGGVLARHLTGLVDEAGHYDNHDAHILGHVTQDLLVATCANALSEDGVRPQTGQQALLVQVDDFIRQRLDDPELSPQSIAEAHQISIRYLHRLFQRRNGPTVAALIRQLRLERARHDLRDPRLARQTIQAIAHRWGFTTYSQFQRLFRSSYGATPSDYRHTHHHSNGGPIT